MEAHVCVVCAKEFNTGSLLLDKRMRAKFERTTLTGYGMCEEHQKLKDDGFVALIECDPTKSEIVGDQVKKIDHAYRTGNICHLRASVFSQVFNVPVPEKMVCFVEPGVIDKLKSLQEQAAVPQSAEEGERK